MNADLPAWYYTVMSAIDLVALIKKAAANPGDAPAVRPLGKGACRRRSWTRAAVAHVGTEGAAEPLMPEQVAGGVPGGIHKLVLGVKAHLEANPGHAVVKFDFTNAYNMNGRAEALKKLLEQKAGLRRLAPL